MDARYFVAPVLDTAFNLCVAMLLWPRSIILEMMVTEINSLGEQWGFRVVLKTRALPSAQCFLAEMNSKQASIYRSRRRVRIIC